MWGETPLDQTRLVIGTWDRLIPRSWPSRTMLSTICPNIHPRAGQTDGEILETLWAVLHEVSHTTQTMTLAHRSEVLDAHMLLEKNDQYR